MDRFINIYLKPKEYISTINQLNWGYRELLLKVILPFSLFSPLGYLLGFTLLKGYYMEGINQFIDYLKNDPKADRADIDYMNKILNMLTSNDFEKILMFIGVIWIFELLRPVILNGIVFFFSRPFGSNVTDQKKTLSLTSFSLIPLWVSGIFNMVNTPITTFILFLASFYTYYLLFIGAEKVLGISSENSKNFQFIIAVAIFNIIVSGIFGILQTKIIYSIL